MRGIPDVTHRGDADRRQRQEHQICTRIVIIMAHAERAEALFLSYLQPSQQPTPAQVATAIEAALRLWGPAGCAAAAAAEYGEHPGTAPNRMRWALQLLALTPLPRHELVAVG
jgi:hypothetical protein